MCFPDTAFFPHYHVEYKACTNVASEQNAFHFFSHDSLQILVYTIGSLVRPTYLAVDCQAVVDKRVHSCQFGTLSLQVICLRGDLLRSLTLSLTVRWLSFCKQFHQHNGYVPARLDHFCDEHCKRICRPR